MKISLVAACAVLAVTLAGCGDPNAGDQKIADFKTWLADNPEPGVSVESAAALNALPWVGNGEVTVLIEAPADLESAASHLCGYDDATATGVEFMAHLGAVVTALPCPATDMAELDDTVTLLNDLIGLDYAELQKDDSLELSFRSRRALATGYPTAAGNPAFAEVSARTEGLAVIDNAFASDAIRAAFRTQVAQLDQLVKVINVQTRSGSEPEGLSVAVTSRAGRVKQQMESLTPGVRIRVTQVG